MKPMSNSSNDQFAIEKQMTLLVFKGINVVESGKKNHSRMNTKGQNIANYYVSKRQHPHINVVESGKKNHSRMNTEGQNIANYYVDKRQHPSRSLTPSIVYNQFLWRHEDFW